MAAADPSRGASASGAAATSPDLRYLGLVNTGPVAANRPAAESVDAGLGTAGGRPDGPGSGSSPIPAAAPAGRLMTATSFANRAATDRSTGERSTSNRWAVSDRLLARVTAYLQGRPLFLSDLAACADPGYRLNVRVVAEKAWHTLFARCLFLRPGPTPEGSPRRAFAPIGP